VGAHGVIAPTSLCPDHFDEVILRPGPAAETLPLTWEPAAWAMT
jgi:hypothetical protein